MKNKKTEKEFVHVGEIEAEIFSLCKEINDRQEILKNSKIVGIHEDKSKNNKFIRSLFDCVSELDDMKEKLKILLNKRILIIKSIC